VNSISVISDVLQSKKNYPKRIPIAPSRPTPRPLIVFPKFQRRASFVARMRPDKSRLSLFLSLAKQRKKREEGLILMSTHNTHQKPDQGYP